MTRITINLDKEVEKVISKRAKSNFFTLEEQIEDILRKSAVRTKSGGYRALKIDDKLVSVFSREKRCRKKKKKK